jgi:hypothetical protein
LRSPTKRPAKQLASWRVGIAAALSLLRGEEKGGVVAVVISDSGLKYLSTDLWE